jgi:two-component system, cell cycle sensor histidine kinase and response regulator CckA
VLFRSMNILIVDDKGDNLYMLETLLKGNGFEVISAGNGIEALEKLKKTSVNLIISDILMPKMDGFQLCKAVKEDSTLKAIPFILYTASYTDDKDEELSLKMGADKYIKKPVDPEVFLSAVNDLLQDVQEGKTIARQPVYEEKGDVLQLYNERLIMQLEQKMIDLEKEIAERKKMEKEVQKRIKDLEDFYDMAIGRELKMIELKNEIKELKEELSKYKKG